MKVILACNFPNDDKLGSVRTPRRMVKELNGLGVDASLLSKEDLIQATNTRIDQLTAPFRIAASLVRRAADADVVDIAGGDAWAYAGYARVRRPKQAIVARSNGLWQRALTIDTEHGQSSRFRRLASQAYQRWVLCRWEQRSLEAADMAVFLSQPDADDVVRQGWKTADSVTVINPGVDDYFESTVPLEDRTGIAFVGTFFYRKGSDIAAVALSRVMKARADVRFAVFGAGLPAEAVMAQFDPDVRDRVTVMDAVPAKDLAERLKRFSIMVFPTRYEGFGIVVLEAMRAGLAVVTTHTGAGVDIVRNGQNGTIVPIGDVETTFQAIMRLLDDVPFRIAIARTAIEDTRGRTWRKAAEKLLRAYERALAVVRSP